MTALIVLAVIAALIAALLLLRLRIRIKYREELELIVGASVFTFKIMPRKKKKVNLRRYSLKNIRKRELEAARPKKHKKEKKKKPKPEKTPEDSKAKKKPKMTLEEILELISVLLGIVGGVFKKFGRYPVIDVRKLFIRAASDDPEKTAVTYGIIAQVLIYLREVFLNVKNFRLHNDTRVGVEADFMSSKMLFDIDIEITIRVWHILSIGLGAGFAFIKHMIKSSSKTASGQSGSTQKTAAVNNKNKKVQTKNKTTGG